MDSDVQHDVTTIEIATVSGPTQTGYRCTCQSRPGIACPEIKRRLMKEGAGFVMATIGAIRSFP